MFLRLTCICESLQLQNTLHMKMHHTHRVTSQMNIRLVRTVVCNESNHGVALLGL